MPGAYAHITLVNLMREPSRLQRDLGFSNAASASVLDYLRYCELGAVSPDYPYLAVTNHNAARWADLMHYEHTCAVIKAGVSEVLALTDEPRRRAFAWLLGYAAHVATDVTIHPVVELKVGRYAENKKEHRICEMHQDAYIFQRMNLGEIGVSEHLASGILRCSAANTREAMDTTIRTVWEAALRAVYPEESRANPPTLDEWHRSFDRMVNRIAEEGNKLLPIARHVAVNCGLTYPLANEIDQQYTHDLRVPSGNTLHYDQIFARAIESVGKVWSAIEKAVFKNDMAPLTFLGNWDLDTGRDESNQLVFWV